MDISIKIGNLIYKQNTGLLFCKLLLFSIFIPSRGSILGISFGANLVLLVCLAGQFLTSKKIERGIPKFYVIYILIYFFTLIVHFGSNGIVNTVVSLVRLITPIYVILIGITDMDRFMSMLKYIVKMFTVYGVFGIIESITHFNFFDALTGTRVVYENANALRFGLARNRGALDISINNGMLLCLVLCIAAYVLIYSSQKEHKWYQLCYLIIFIDTFLTLSRAVWMELVITQILIFIALTPRSKLKIIGRILLACACGGLILLLVNPDLLEKIVYISKEMFSSTYDAFSGTDTAESSDMSYGVGHRFALWSWVWEKVQGNVLLGKGHATPFIYVISSSYVKESIEVMWLYLLYHIGLVGLFGYIVYQCGSIYYMIKGNKVEKKVFTDKKITFNYVMLVATVLYFFTQFSCSGFEDLRFYYILLALVIAYNRLCRQKLSKEKE